MAGIDNDPDRPGFKRIIMKPQPAGDLKWAWARYRSPYGVIKSSWKLEGNGAFRLDIVVPANTTAEVWIPVRERKPPVISESGVVVFRNGKAAGRVAGVKYLRFEPGFAVFEVGAGSYRFRKE